MITQPHHLFTMNFNNQFSILMVSCITRLFSDIGFQFFAILQLILYIGAAALRCFHIFEPKKLFFLTFMSSNLILVHSSCTTFSKRMKELKRSYHLFNNFKLFQEFLETKNKCRSVKYPNFVKSVSVSLQKI